MSPMQQIFLGLGAVAKKTYVDDVFSTFLYEGTGSAQNINNGLDLSGEGGMTWIKGRSVGASHIINDTVRGAGNRINSNSNASSSSGSAFLSAFNSNGFSIGNDNDVSYDDQTFSSWSFRKAPGFFDIQQYSAGSSNTSGSIGNPNFQVNHDLGCIPGMILIKRTNSTNDWFVWIRGKEGVLNSTGSFSGASALPLANVTSTYFKFSAGNGAYNDPGNFIAYIFAGGESDAATARSVDFQSDTGPAATLTIPYSSDLNVSTGNFTIEGWFYVRSENKAFFSTGGTQTVADQAGVYVYDDEWSIRLTMRDSSGNLVQNATNIGATPRRQWFHLAISRDSNTYRIFINGTQAHTFTSSATLNNPNYPFNIGSWNNASQGHWQGKISNFRVVKGTAVYTSSFKVPTEPLTNITNTKLLCCNNASVTGSTVTPATITAVGSTVADTDSPFDDPAAHIFGESGSESLIKCGSYKTDSNEDAIIHLGWEPQWVLAKRTDSSTGGDWMLYDSMRGLSNRQDVLTESGVSSALLVPNNANSETNARRIGVDATGFVQDAYGANREYIYCAIRRPDGYVGKPPELGTAVFAMDGTANGSNVFPQFTSGFPVDFSLTRNPTQSGTWDSWHAGARLLQGTYQLSATSNTWADGGNFQYDYNDGIFIGGWTHYMSWMWKRHAGFDIVTYTGGGTGQTEFHSLNAVPEMIWVKCRSGAHDWAVYHKGLNGGTNPEQKYLVLNSTAAEVDNSNRWNDTAPTATTFTVGGANSVGDGSAKYIAMLFASVPTISAVGFYDGHASNNINLTSQLDFTPRFFMCKSTTASTGWLVVDNTRDVNMGKRLFLDSTAAETSYDAVWAMSKYLEPNKAGLSANGEKYIFYAHA